MVTRFLRACRKLKRFENVRITGFVLALAAFYALTGCTTLRGTRQRIKISTHPEGAYVYHDGQLLGQSPGFFEIRRQRSSSLVLKRPGFTDLEVPMHTSYRWGDSFFSNFIWFFWGAPIGWATDLLTKTSWTYDSLPDISLSPYRQFGGQIPSRYEKARVIAIAPPQYKYELLSDEVGARLEESLKKRYPHAKILPYNDTYLTFYKYSYDYSSKQPEEVTDDLYYDLGASHIAETDITRNNDTIHLETDLKNIYTEKSNDHLSKEFKASEFRNAGRSTFAQEFLSLVSILPNNVTFDFTTPTIDMEQTALNPINPGLYTATPDRDFNLWAVLSGFGITNVQSPNMYKNFKVTFRFTPDLKINYHKLHFNKSSGPNELDGISFSWYKFLAGIGPELGLVTPAGFLYFQLVPLYGANWISWEKSGQDNSNTEFGFNIESEVGFLFFVSRTVNLKLFARTVSTPADQWSYVLNQASGGNPIRVDRSSYGMTGLSIGYYFPSARTEAKRLFH